MKLTKQIANFAGAAAIALSASAMDAQAGNTPPGYGNNPTPTPGCNGNPNCGGGGHTPTPPPVVNNHGGIGIGKGGMGGQGGLGGAGGVATSNANANATASNTGVNNSVNFPRQVGFAPAAIAYANGNCQTGIGFSLGTFVATGGFSYTQTDYKCMDYQMAATLGIEGMRLGRNEVVLMSLATLNNLSANIRLSTQQVANGYLHCGRRAMESNLIVGTAIAVNGGPCPGGASRGLAHHYNRRVKAPRAVHTQSRYECVQAVKQHNMCITKYPSLANH
jgi:hypothetical protein